MKIRKTSSITGVTRIRDIPVDPLDYEEFKRGGVSISDAMPYLNQADTDFILSGIVEGEWAEAFKEAAIQE